MKRYTIGVEKVSESAEKFHTFDTASCIPVKYHESMLSDVCITPSVCTLDLTSCGELNIGKEQFAQVISYPYLEVSLLEEEASGVSHVSAGRKLWWASRSSTSRGSELTRT